MSENNWWDSASCQGLWYEFDQDTELRKVTREDNEYLRKICSTCPVRTECLEDALAYSDEYGFRGGLTAKERQQLMKKAGIPSWTRKQMLVIEESKK